MIEQKERKEDENISIEFEEILDQYLYQRPQRGQILEGEIEAINDDAIILDVGLKRDAIVLSREVNNLDDEFYEALSVGDSIPIQVSHTPIGDQDLLVSIDSALEYQSWQKAEALLDEDQIIEVEVIGSNRGGLLVSFDQLEGFVPNSHVPALRKIHAREQVNQHKLKMKGSKLKVKAIEVNLKRGRLVFSALEAHRELREERLQSLEVGEVITGKVVNVVDFGLFVDLGGIDGLVHLSELDWQNMQHLSKVAKMGDEIEVKVIGVDIERQRVQLSRKALLPNPWDEIEAHYVLGNLLVNKGRLSAVIDFGCSGVGDPACDLAIAWTLFSGGSREAFRAALPVDGATWARGRGWALWKGLITLAEHINTNPLKADKARHTIDEVLADHKPTT